MDPITILIVSYFDQKNIKSKLSEIANAGDEVIIVENGGSLKDYVDNYGIFNQRNITLRYFDKTSFLIENNKECGSLGIARNYALSKATNSWVLVLDSDEYISPQGITHLRQLTNDSGNMGYFLNWNTYDNNGNLIIKDYKMSFLRVKSGVHYEGFFHENPTVSIRRLNGSCGAAPVEIIHEPFRKESAWKKQAYLKRLFASVRLNPSCARLRWFLGLSLYKIGKISHAERQLRVAYEMENDLWHPVERINACFLLGYSRTIAGELTEARKYLLRALSLYKINEKDPEMVAYGHILSCINAYYRIKNTNEIGFLSNPENLFYCF